MASSSTRRTHQEQKLSYWYRHAYARLHFIRAHKEAFFLASTYKSVLDCNDGELMAELQHDSAWWQEVKQACQKQRPSENIWTAADCLADTATTLTEFGRAAEAARFSAWAQELYGLAVDYKACEDAARQAEVRRALVRNGVPAHELTTSDRPTRSTLGSTEKRCEDREPGQLDGSSKRRKLAC